MRQLSVKPLSFIHDSKSGGNTVMLVAQSNSIVAGDGLNRLQYLINEAYKVNGIEYINTIDDNTAVLNVNYSSFLYLLRILKGTEVVIEKPVFIEYIGKGEASCILLCENFSIEVDCGDTSDNCSEESVDYSIKMAETFINDVREHIAVYGR